MKLHFVSFQCFVLFWSGINADIRSYPMSCGGDKVTSHVGELMYRPSTDMTSFQICQFVIRPDRDVIGSGGVIFYFTELNLPHMCGQSYLKFMDGVHGVNGLAEKICSNNDTLLDKNVFFTTNDDKLRIEYSDLQAHMSFAIKFAAYSMKDWAPSCSGHKCPNKLCVPLGYVCSSDIRICGTADNSCANKGDADNTSSSDVFVDILRHIAIAIMVISGLLILKKLCQHRSQYVSKCRNRCQDGCCSSSFGQIRECCSPKCCRRIKVHRPLGVIMTRYGQSPEPTSTRADPETAEVTTTQADPESGVPIPSVTIRSDVTLRRSASDIPNVFDSPPSYDQLEMYSADNHEYNDLDIPVSETGHDIVVHHVILNNYVSTDVISSDFINTDSGSAISDHNRQGQISEGEVGTDLSSADVINTDSGSAISDHNRQEQVSEGEVGTDLSSAEVLPVLPPSYDEAVRPPLYSDVIANKSKYMA